MIYIPDLFSAYAKGQEEAIDRNWNDLSQYESVEQARTNNDVARINLQAGMDDYGNNRAISNALGSQAMIGEDLLKRMYPGDAANAEINSILAGAQYNSVMNNLPLLDTATNSTLVNNLGQQVYTADANTAFRNVDTNLLPEKTAAYKNAQGATYQVANQNSTAAPIDNQATITSNRLARGLNDATIATGVAQNAYTQANLPLANRVQVGALNQSLTQMEDVPNQQKRADAAQVAAQINNLRQQVSANAAAVAQMQQMVQQNPAMASQYNSVILRTKAAINSDMQTIAALESAYGSVAQNTVQSLMGN